MLGGGTVKELYELKGEGRSMRGIASDLGISRATVRKYALSPEVPKPKARAKRGSKLDAYAGAPCNFCPARTGRPTPEQLWMCLKDWTIAWQCSTRGAASHLRKRRRVRVSFGASPGEPHTHPLSINPPTVWVLNGRPSCRLWTLTTMPSIPSPPPVATARDEFAK